MKASSADSGSSCDATQGAAVLRVRVAHGFLARARGLIGRPVPAPGCGLLLPGVAMVHGFGMQYKIDLVFLDADGRIVQCAQLAPGRIRACRRARDVLEMRAGEVARLGLLRGMQVERVPVADITEGLPAPIELPPPVTRCAAQVAELPLPACLFAALLVTLPWHQAGRAASPTGVATAAQGVLAPVVLSRPLAAQTLQRLEDEAEALYRNDLRRSTDEAELLRIYESLAELAADRSSHAWLRIGNIHQRANAVGAAIDAYRRVLNSGPGAADAGDAGAQSAGPSASTTAEQRAEQRAAQVAERKALLNLAALALDQARRSLARLNLLSAPAGDSARREDGEARLAAQGAADASTGVDSYNRQLRSLEQQLTRQPERQGDVVAADASRDIRQGPYLIERYTASARRNAVKEAKGSLHVNPADESPARPIAPPRSRPTDEQLPRVEYLLGDPNRSTPASDAQQVNGRRGTGGDKASTPKRVVKRPASDAGSNRGKGDNPGNRGNRGKSGGDSDNDDDRSSQTQAR